jgi:hypothetical protein
MENISSGFEMEEASGSEGTRKPSTTSQGKGDYHEEMDAKRFENWFSGQLLPNIPPNSVIVIDNASYHTKQENKVPTKSSRKDLMTDYLTKMGVTFEKKMDKGKTVRRNCKSAIGSRIHRK